MIGFIIRRLGEAIIVTLGVTVITFALLHLLPGSLARDVVGPRASPQAIAQFTHQNGLDKPVYVQYWLFLDKLLHGNLGYSYQYNRTVDSLLASELPRDLVLGGLALIFSVIIAIPVGIAQAVRRNGPLDYAGTGISFLLYSMPQYAIALLLIQFLSITFHVFPAEAPQSSSAFGMLAHPSGLVLPVAALTLVTFAQFSRYMRSLGDRHPGPGLHTHGARQGTLRAARPLAAPASQLAHRGRHAGWAVNPAGDHRDADHRAGVQLPGCRARVSPGVDQQRLRGDARHHRAGGRCHRSRKPVGGHRLCHPRSPDQVLTAPQPRRSTVHRSTSTYCPRAVRSSRPATRGWCWRGRLPRTGSRSLAWAPSSW